MGQVPLKITNDQFLTALFGDEKPWVHVTDFTFDPNNIPKDKHLIAWKGDYYSRYHLSQSSNQYFTISLFYCDDQQQARRRKALYRATPVIVLDDVKEKLPIVEVQKLPRPAWILETSQGSEQWGYILDTPATDRNRVENLLDGLVANGLAPDGRDPGMKGVTRYVRLPGGVNNKSSKLINGQPWQCQIRSWQPSNRVTLEQLAAPFSVDLNAVRRERRVDGAANISDHPLIHIPDIIRIKEVRSDGRFDITCPWVHEHTNKDDSGSAIFTNADGSIGFKCHHGVCQNRTGKDLMNHIEESKPGFKSHFRNWIALREFSSMSLPSFINGTSQKLTLDFLNSSQSQESVNFLLDSQQEVTEDITLQPDVIQLMIDELRRMRPSTAEARELAQKILKVIDPLAKIEQNHWHNLVCDLMSWSKNDFKEIIKDLRSQWYGEKVNDVEFYDDVVYVKELNQFYDYNSQIFFSSEAFQNSFAHEDVEARKVALQEGRVQKVDKLDYTPKRPRIFTEGRITYANTWSDATQSRGIQGDVSPWVNHFDAVGWGEHRKHVEQFMAFTLRYPETKINHMLLMGSGEGVGKDFLLYPLIRAMGDNSEVISGEELLEGFNDYLLSIKHLHVNETELGDRREATAVSNKLKPIASAPPEKLRVNQKGIKPVKIRNVVNGTMTTNSLMPLRLNGPSRRFYAMWSDLNPRDRYKNMLPEWQKYWDAMWRWMKDGDGWQHVTYYLTNVVDLSDFKPGAAPPMTEFLREIGEQSKSGMHTSLESFIEKQFGLFKCDILTAADMSEVIRNGGFANNELTVDAKYFTSQRVGQLMTELHTYRQVRATSARLWIIRNEEKYAGLTSGDLHKEYERQIRQARDEKPLQVVN